jgi:hypothetical protein
MKRNRRSKQLMFGFVCLAVFAVLVLVGAAQRIQATASDAAWYIVSPAVHAKDFGEHISALLMYFLYMMGAAIVVAAVAPRATAVSVRAADQEAARCLITGFMGFVGIGLAMAANGWLMRFAFWTPFAIVLIVLAIAVGYYAWILGLAFVGGRVSERLGWGEAGFIGRVAIGLGLFCVASLIPFIGAWTGFVELLAWIVGLGSLVVTGLGSHPNWLGDKLYRKGVR